jgi:hypothetical protein
MLSRLPGTSAQVLQCLEFSCERHQHRKQERMMLSGLQRRARNKIIEINEMKQIHE